MSGLRFYIVNAFTTDPYGGNPAVVVPVQDFPEDKIMQAIAKNFNQPMVSFIRATGIDSEVANFDVRWFSPAHEVKLCGHATLASSKLIFSTPSLVPTSIKLLNFKTASGRLLTARKDGDWIEMTIPTGAVQEPSPEEFERLAAIIRQGLGKEVTVKHIEVGGEGYEEYLLAVIEEKDDLGGCQLNHDAFKATGRMANIITSSSSTPGVSFVTRMFAPSANIPEDHVCGSANCLLGPYWSKALGKGDAVMVSKQVSQRGGTLKVAWSEKDALLTLAGEAIIVAKGELL